MNAVEYFKKNGFNKSKIHLDIMNAENWHNGFYNDLKRLVESYELVEKFGGLDKSKNYIDNFILPELSLAISYVEKCK